MRRPLLLALILLVLLVWTFLSLNGVTQIPARTQSGKELPLSPDATWKYVRDPTGSPPQMVKFTKPSSAKKFFKTQSGDFGLWYDESKWRPEGNEKFRLIGENGFAIVEAQEKEVTGSLKEVVLTKFRLLGDFKLILEEKRVVNDREILCVKVEGNIKEATPLTFYGYYYSGKEGAIQVLTYTEKNLFGRYEEEFTKFLNGLVISPTRAGSSCRFLDRLSYCLPLENGV